MQSDKPTPTEDKLSDNLLLAVHDFIDGKGGLALVVGGIEIQKWPSDRDLNYRLCIRFTGRPPKADGH